MKRDKIHQIFVDKLHEMLETEVSQVFKITVDDRN